MSIDLISGAQPASVELVVVALLHTRSPTYGGQKNKTELRIIGVSPDRRAVDHIAYRLHIIIVPTGEDNLCIPGATDLVYW